MYDLFDQLPGSPIGRHTIPHEIVRCVRPLLIMPHASHISEIYTPTTSSVLAAFDQILEVRGARYLTHHRRSLTPYL